MSGGPLRWGAVRAGSSVMQISIESEEAIQTLDVMKHLSLHSLHLIGDKGTEGSRYWGFVFFPDRRGDHLVDKGSSVGHLEEGRRISPGFLIKNFGAVQESRF